MPLLTKDTKKDIILWDIKSWYPILNYWQENSRLNLNNSKSLEIGAYQGGLSLWLALNGSNVICSDIENPEKKASELHNRYKISGCIKYEKINALNIPFENEFDIVVFKSVLGGIGRNNNKKLQQKAISEILKSLKPNGELFFAENLIGSPLHRFFRENFVPWGKEWRYVTLDEMKDFLRSFRELNIEERGFLGAFGWTELVRNVFAFADQFFFNHIMISNWKYIIYGIARK
jgi:SAM-dependent methyltransferase